MPNAVTHFLIPAILVALFRDFYLSKKDKRKFPLHYVLIAGLGGLLMDFDYIFYYLLIPFNFSFPSHRIFFHNLFFPLVFLFLGLIFIGVKNKELGKHKLKFSTIFFIVSFSGVVHLFLDWFLMGQVLMFYPFLDFSSGLNLLKKLPEQFHTSIMPIIDAVVLIFWMIYLEVKHKISDYI